MKKICGIYDRTVGELKWTKTPPAITRTSNTTHFLSIAEAGFHFRTSVPFAVVDKEISFGVAAHFGAADLTGGAFDQFRLTRLWPR